MGVLGPSGAGKSTIFKMLTMALGRDRGDISILGCDFKEEDTPDKLTEGQIGIVY
jgi:ABC-type multidrug transport system ATPase subunit